MLENYLKNGVQRDHWNHENKEQVEEHEKKSTSCVSAEDLIFVLFLMPKFITNGCNRVENMN